MFARSAVLQVRHAEYAASGKLEAGLAVPRVQFYCLHHLFDDEVAPFRRLLSRLRRHFEFVSYSEAVRRILTGDRPDRPLACFSSDDGFASNMTLARVMDEYGVPMMFFLNPVALSMTDARQIEEFCRVTHEARPTPFLSWENAQALHRAGHEIGNHTVNHVVCSRTPTPELADEIWSAKLALENRFGPVVHFAWPYGWFEHFSETGRSLVFEMGHVSCASTVRGVHLATDALPVADELCIRRLSIRATDPIGHVLFRTARLALNPDPDSNGFPPLQPGA